MQHGVHYIDLADDRSFVKKVRSLTASTGVGGPSDSPMREAGEAGVPSVGRTVGPTLARISHRLPRETAETPRRQGARPRPPQAYSTVRRGGRPSATQYPRAYRPFREATGEECGLGRAGDPPAVCTGWSTVSALSGSLVRIGAAGLERIEEIYIHMAPGNRLARGNGTIASLLHSVGRPLSIWRDGRWQTVTGWSAPR